MEDGGKVRILSASAYTIQALSVSDAIKAGTLRKRMTVRQKRLQDGTRSVGHKQAEPRLTFSFPTTHEKINLILDLFP